MSSNIMDHLRNQNRGRLDIDDNQLLGIVVCLCQYLAPRRDHRGSPARLRIPKELIGSTVTVRIHHDIRNRRDRIQHEALQ